MPARTQSFSFSLHLTSTTDFERTLDSMSVRTKSFWVHWTGQTRRDVVPNNVLNHQMHSTTKCIESSRSTLDRQVSLPAYCMLFMLVVGVVTVRDFAVYIQDLKALCIGWLYPGLMRSVARVVEYVKSFRLS